MTQIFFPPESGKKEKIYCYINDFANVVVAKVKGFKDRQCERVIFPTEKFLFMANDDCRLEIHSSTDIGIIKDTIVCSKLEIVEE